MSDYGKYGVGGKMPIPPYKEEYEGLETDRAVINTGTSNYVPDKDVLGIKHKGEQGDSKSSDL